MTVDAILRMPLGSPLDGPGHEPRHNMFWAAKNMMIASRIVSTINARMRFQSVEYSPW